jgi:hypothetical protein
VTTRRTYVLDTSVLLSDPGALMRFGNSDVVLPLVVIGELEDKRNHPELGWFARQALPRSPSAKTAARCTSSSTTVTRRRCPPVSATTATTAGSWWSR